METKSLVYKHLTRQRIFALAHLSELWNLKVDISKGFPSLQGLATPKLETNGLVYKHLTRQRIFALANLSELGISKWILVRDSQACKDWQARNGTNSLVYKIPNPSKNLRASQSQRAWESQSGNW